jgi:hypothetical protein
VLSARQRIFKFRGALFAKLFSRDPFEKGSPHPLKLSGRDKGTFSSRYNSFFLTWLRRKHCCSGFFFIVHLLIAKAPLKFFSKATPLPHPKSFARAFSKARGLSRQSLGSRGAPRETPPRRFFFVETCQEKWTEEREKKVLGGK